MGQPPTVLVTGATGFIGSRLAAELVARGLTVRSMTRHPDTFAGAGSPVGADVGDPASLEAALDGVDVAVYLVHSLDRPDFESRDAAAARAFGRAAGDAGVRQIVYLGGLGAESAELSPHLRSRRQVERLLAGHGVPVTALRAAIVVGHGGVSWELTRQLVKNLPAMVVPRWTSTRTQPIAVDDVIRYLAGVIDEPRAFGQTYEIGGPEVLTPRLSSYWLSLVTDVDVTTGRNLIDSMSTEVVVTDDRIVSLVPGEPISYREAVRRAVDERDTAGR